MFLLGPLECTVDDQPVVLSGWRMSGVLAALALDAPAPMPRGRLIEVLWGEAPPTSAVNAVQVQVSRLRRALGQDLVQTIGDGYRLADAVQVDVHDFEAAVRAGQHALRDGDTDTAEALLSGALARWRGPALGGVTAPGLESDARRLDDLRLDALHARLEADLILRRHAQVVGELRALVSSNPYDERLRGLLMMALYRSGRQDEAFAAYAEGVRILADDLGVDPTPELSDLHRRLLRHEDHTPSSVIRLDSRRSLMPSDDLTGRATEVPEVASLRDHASSDAATARDRGRGAFAAQIGREVELRVLRQLAQQARQEGDLRVALIGGEAGMGKTTLVHAFLAGLETASVLRGECLDLGTARLPYAPVVQALRPVLRDTGRWGLRLDAHARATLARLVPELGEASSASDGVQGFEVGLTQLYEHLLAVVEQTAAATGLLVLVVEDVHFCDPATRDMLAFLVGNLAAAPVFLVLTARTDEIGRPHPVRPLVTSLDRSPRATMLQLTPLGASALAELVGALAGDRRTLDAVLDRSGGNPLYALELAAGGGGVTDQLSDLLLARVDRCEPTTQQVLRVAAAAGTDIDHDMLAAVTALPDQQLTACLREAVAAQLMVVAGKGYRFRHALIGEAVETSLLPGEEAAIHGALADLLAADGGTAGPHAARLARHLRAAGRPADELEAAHAAAHRALEVFAYRDAQTMFERVAELWPDVPDAAQRASTDLAGVYETAAVCAISNLDHRRAVELAEEALARLDTEAEPARAALVHVLIGRGHETDWERAEAAYRTALAVLPAGDSAARARVEAALSTALMFEGQFSEAQELAEDAAAVAHRVGVVADEAEALTTLGVIHGQRGRATESERLFDLAQVTADASGSIRHQIRCARSRSGILANQGEFDAAIAECWRGIAIARDHGLDRTHGMHLRGNLMGPMTDAGRLDEALAIGREASDMVPEGRPRAAVLTHMGIAAVRRGDVDLALRLQEQAEATMSGSQQSSFVAFWGQLAAEVAMARGDHAAALQRARVALAAVTSPDGPVIWAGEVGALFGEVVLAGRLDEDLAPVVAAVRAAAAEGETRIATGERLRLEAIAAQVAGGDQKGVIAAWERALAAYADLPMPERMARCHVALTELHLAAGDRPRAHASWAEATRLAEMIRAAPLADAAQALGRRSGFADTDDVTHTA